MGTKYEVLYWDYKNGKYVTVEHTKSIFHTSLGGK